MQGTNTFCTAPNLRGRLFAGDVQNRCLRGAGRGDIQKKSGLSNPGFAGKKDHSPGNNTPTENTVKLTDSGWLRARALSTDVIDGLSRLTRRECDSGTRNGSRGAGLFHGVPLVALSTLANPFG